GGTTWAEAGRAEAPALPRRAPRAVAPAGCCGRRRRGGGGASGPSHGARGQAAPTRTVHDRRLRAPAHVGWGVRARAELRAAARGGSLGRADASAAGRRTPRDP